MDASIYRCTAFQNRVTRVYGHWNFMIVSEISFYLWWWWFGGSICPLSYTQAILVASSLSSRLSHPHSKCLLSLLLLNQYFPPPPPPPPPPAMHLLWRRTTSAEEQRSWPEGYLPWTRLHHGDITPCVRTPRLTYKTSLLYLAAIFLGHVIEEEQDVRIGVELLTSTRPKWSCSPLDGHISWHLALYYLGT